MGFYLTFYSVDKDTVLPPTSGEGGIGQTLEYDDVFDNDAVSPKWIASWKNQRILVEIMERADVCPHDLLGPWVVAKEKINNIIASIHPDEDDLWTDYFGFSNFLSEKLNSFDFEKEYLFFTAA